MTATKDEGVFSHDVILTNGSAMTFGKCDLAVTVYLTSGKRPPVAQYWASWAAKEEKRVNVSAGGSIERVDVAGTMVNTATGEKGRIDTTFEWKPKPAPPPGG